MVNCIAEGAALINKKFDRNVDVSTHTAPAKGFMIGLIFGEGATFKKERIWMYKLAYKSKTIQHRASDF